MDQSNLVDRLQLDQYIGQAYLAEQQAKESGGVWRIHTCPVCKTPFVYLRSERNRQIAIVQESCRHIYLWNNSKNYMFMDAAMAEFFDKQGITFRRIS